VQTRLEAFVDLLERANSEPRKEKIRGEVVSVGRI